MSSKELEDALQVLEDVESASGKIEKRKVLEHGRKNKTLQTMLRMSLDRSTFGIKPASLESYSKVTLSLKAPKIKSVGDAWAAFLLLAKQLASRKLAGNAAKVAIADMLGATKSKLARKWFHRILAKNLRCGIDRTVSDVWPGLVIRWGVPKGKSLVDQKSHTMDSKLKDAVIKALPKGVRSQPKCDGVHGVAVCDTGAMHSSSGDLSPAIAKYAAAIAEAVATLKLPKVFNGYVPLISGECEAKYDPKVDKDWDSPWGKGGAIAKFGRTGTGFDQSRITPDKQKLIDNDFIFVIYDIYPDIAQQQSVLIKHSTRRKLLRQIAAYCDKNAKRLGIRKGAIVLIPEVKCFTWKALKKQHETWLRLGYEGSILRLPGMRTLADAKTRNITTNFLKWKQYDYVDAVILGIVAGKQNTKNAKRGGSFLVWLPAKSTTSKVTIPTDAAKDLALKHEASFVGYMIEASQQKDAGGDVAKSRFPTLSRFRDDLPPLSEKEVQKLCKQAKLPVRLSRKKSDKSAVLAMAAACNSQTRASDK